MFLKKNFKFFIILFFVLQVGSLFPMHKKPKYKKKKPHFNLFSFFCPPTKKDVENIKISHGLEKKNSTPVKTQISIFLKKQSELLSKEQKKKSGNQEFISFCNLKENYKKNKNLSPWEFKKVAQKFVEVVKKDICLESNCVNNKAPNIAFFDLKKPVIRNMFFGQKILLKQDSEVVFHGDIHGDLDSLILFIEDLVVKKYLDENNPFKIKKKNLFLVFLGDYIDRGDNSFEVLYILLRLKIENPTKVVLIRGNHEDIMMNQDFDYITQMSQAIGFKRNEKTIYAMFPSFVFIGKKANGDGDHYAHYSLFCHGGLEIRFNPHNILSDKRGTVYQWIDRLDISWLTDYDRGLYKKIMRSDVANFFSDTYNFPSRCENIGFLWSDFMYDKKIFIKRSARGPKVFSFGFALTQALLKAYGSKKYQVKTIFRGHQHADPNMYKMFLKTKGFYNSWAPWKKSYTRELTDKFPVWTLNVSPNTKYNKKEKAYNYDTYAILKMTSLFSKWKLQAFNLKTFKK